jgi:molybdate transport system ATP-binding protein
MNIRVTHAPMAVGQALRCKVHARDISLALHNSEASSILNRLPVTVVSELAADNAAHVLIRLDAGGTPLLARITRFSRDQLGIHRASICGRRSRPSPCWPELVGTTATPRGQSL